MFKNRKSIDQVEESNELAPKFDENGLIVVTTIDSESNEILMVGYMNQEALKKTIETKEAHYFSRSRNIIWHKGASSGYIQKIDEILIDDYTIEILLATSSKIEKVVLKKSEQE